MHLTIDGFGANPEKLASEQLVRELLDGYPDSIGMTKIAPAHVQQYVGSKPEDWGVSGFVLIAESHIAIHTFPDRGYVWIDIFSCKGFDVETALKRAREAFQLQRDRARVLERGLEYPHTVSEAIPLAEEERHAVVGGIPSTAVPSLDAR
ncbi:MAG: S-adenosylmethionine decarboxylase [Dehalococcoidia bacterium]